MEALENVQLAVSIICNKKLVCYSPRMVPVASYCFYYIINTIFTSIIIISNISDQVSWYTLKGLDITGTVKLLSLLLLPSLK